VQSASGFQNKVLFSNFMLYKLMDQTMRKLYLLLLLCSSIALQAQNQSTELDAFIRKGLKDWEGLGLSVVVVKDGQTLFSKGYGVTKVGTNEQVDDQTLMAMGSTTKAVTALALGMLVDEGKLALDDKVIKFLPGFKVADPWITRELTIRDLLTHRAGMGNADFLWSTANWSTAEVLDRMQYAETTYPFRSGYTYQNIMYAAAGEVLAAASGMAWETFLTERIFKPLGMRRTFPFHSQVQGMSNVVVPHDKVNGVLSEIPMLSADAIGAAGSVMSCASDMAIWMNFLLNRGVPLLKPRTFDELFSPQVVIPRESFYPTTQLTEPHWTTYGLGWFQHDYKGKMLNYHTGSLPGLIAICGLLLTDRFGVYVFGNTDHIELRHAILYKAIDLFVTGGDRDWHSEILRLYKPEGASTPVSTLPILKNTQPSLPLEAYTGVYIHPMRGKAVVTLREGQLHLSLNDRVQLLLEHRHVDVFQTPGAGQLFRFEWDRKAEVTGLDAGGVHWMRSTDN
jgi:CubicO group peptidase (beta-lactamase class C family)